MTRRQNRTSPPGPRRDEVRAARPGAGRRRGRHRVRPDGRGRDPDRRCHRARGRAAVRAEGEKDPYALPAAKGKDAVELVHGEGGTKYRTAYFSFAEDFTSNLKDTSGLIQVSLAASTRRDGRVLMWLHEHQLAIRSRILVELADTPEEEVISSAGKVRLQKRLTDAVNEVLVEQEGFGGVDNIYFRTFIVQ